MPRINTVNGTDEATNGKEITFKKNVDYFEMAEGTFYSVDALMKKYDCARSTLYNKARDAGMEVVRIAGFPCFMDDETTFAKKERVYNTAHLKPMTSYGELVNIVKTMNELVLVANARTFSHTAEISGIRNDQQLIREYVYRIENAINQILDHLTKENKNA